MLTELCAVDQFNRHPATFLLAGIFLKLMDIAELLGPGDHFFRIDSFNLLPTDGPTRILDKDTVTQRVRRVVIWVDSTLGGPVPTISLSTQGSSAVNAGLQLTPGTWNEIGRIPPDTELYVSSTTALKLNVAVEG
jgi:hypothetical protein